MSTTITIINGITQRTSRLVLKRCMSAFGEVDACHMGDRAVMGDSFTEFPIVRFKSQSAADAALASLKSGQVYLDGVLLQGECRSGTGSSVRQRRGPPPKPAIAPQPEEDTSSRMLVDGGGVDSSFTGRDTRRDDHHRDGHSSRHLAGGGGGGGGPRDNHRQTRQDPPPRRRSASRGDRRRRRRSASRSRGRKESHSRSRSVKRSRGPAVSAGNAGGGSNSVAIANIASYIVGYKAIKLPDASVVGNLESSVSDNPLFVGKRP